MKNDDLTRKEIKGGLNNSIKDGAFASAMGGITSTYITPFALQLGANNSEVGFVNSVPQLLSTVVQSFSGKYIDRKNRKKITNNFALISRVLLVPIALIPFIFINFKITSLIILLALSQSTASISNLAWSSWMGDLVPEKIRGRYFGKRNMIASITAFITTLLGGWILGLYNGDYGFAIIFLLATIFGLLSNYFLNKIPEPSYFMYKHKGHKISLYMKDFLKDLKKYRNFSKFTLHMSLITFAVNLAGPFFIIYMLDSIKIGYQWYAVATAASVITTILMQPYWGKLADKFGDKTIMSVCNILIIFYPFFFLFVRNPIDIILVNLYSGFAWSGFDLTSFNYLLDITPPEKRPAYIGNYKFMTGLALFAGPLIGGFLADFSTGINFLVWSGLQIVFIVSFVLRGLFTAIMLPSLEEARIPGTKVLPVKTIFWRVVAIYPTRGLMHELGYVHYCLICWEKRFGKRFKRVISKL